MTYSLKPKYHFFPITGWLNDPNGLIQYQGKYHLFYQFNPSNPEWGPMHWGHAVSTDLFNWQHLPVALYPEETFEENDMSGIFSGSAIEKDDLLYLMYTQFFDPKCFENHPKEQQCIAYSTNGIDFEKFKDNPVIQAPPTPSFHDYRDPKVWKGKDNHYHCVLGTGENGIPKVIRYSSPDLINWQYEGTLIELDPKEFGPIIECPDFFQLEDRWVLIFSAGFLTEGARKNYYIIGDFLNNHFHPAFFGELDIGNDLYAAQTFLDDQKRRILIGWVHTPERYNYTQEEGWAGIMSLPRELKLNKDGLVQKPVLEIEQFYHQENHLECKNEVVNISPFSNCFVLKIKNIKHSCSIQLENNTDILEFKISENNLTLEEKRNRKNEYKDFYEMDFPIESLQIFIDHSSCEVFINNGKAICTWRIYPVDNYSSLIVDNLSKDDLIINTINCTL
ncbi:MAG: glycoside hydrolase family 32 protein [Thermotogota bacterium]|nr:glycoside hydrolase family 32 protein [Thermotogota bacterium]